MKGGGGDFPFLLLIERTLSLNFRDSSFSPSPRTRGQIPNRIRTDYVVLVRRSPGARDRPTGEVTLFRRERGTGRFARWWMEDTPHVMDRERRGEPVFGQLRGGVGREKLWDIAFVRLSLSVLSCLTSFLSPPPCSNIILGLSNPGFDRSYPFLDCRNLL